MALNVGRIANREGHAWHKKRAESMKLYGYKIVLVAALGLSSTLFAENSALSGATRKLVGSESMATHRTAVAETVHTSEKGRAANEVSIGDFQFIPFTLTVSVGTTVTWTNRDADAHTVNSTTDVFKSPPLDTDEKFSFKFTAPGTYPYYCRLHPQMKGEIVVR